MEKVKKYFMNLSRNQIISICVSIVVIVLTIALTIVKIFAFSSNNKEVDNPVIESIESTTEEYVEDTTENTTEETTDDTTTTTKKYIAKTDIKVSIASGNKEKDEDKGNAHIDVVKKPAKNPIANNTEPQTNPLPLESETSPVIENVDVASNISYASSDKIHKSKYTKYTYIDTEKTTGWYSANKEKYFLDDNSKPLSGLQKLSNRFYDFNDEGNLCSVVGIDVSSWNKEIDWKKVKDDGIDYAILRVGFRGYGTEGEKPPLLDKMLEKNLKGATEAGIDIGLYFFSQAITEDEALEEAGVCINAARGYKIKYPIYFDTEYATGNYSGRADNLSVAERTNIAVAFCEAVKNAGYTPGIYASRNFFYQNLDCSRFSNYHIWLAHYTNSKTDYKNKYDMWQYSSSANIDGIDGRTDINISYYNYKNKTDMRNNHSSNILTDENSLKLILSAEDSMTNYFNNKCDLLYNIALNKINLITNENVKNALTVCLNSDKNDETTTETTTESTTNSNSEKETTTENTTDGSKEESTLESTTQCESTTMPVNSNTKPNEKSTTNDFVDKVSN